MPPDAFPAAPELLTPDNLSALLGAPVASFGFDRDGITAGFFGDVARLRVAYADEGQAARAGLPERVIAKFPSPDPDAFRIGLDRGYYDREVTFYRDYAPACGLRVPACYGSAVDPATGAAVLLLEDLSAMRPGTQRRLPQDAAALLTQLAAFHARLWDDPTLAALPWLPSANSGAERFARDFPTAWPTILRVLGADPSGPLAGLGALVAQRLPSIKAAIAEPPQTFLHADLRVENLFFDDTGAAAIVDWQHCRRGRAAVDAAAYLFGMGAELAEAQERALLADYHAALTAAGVTGYPLDACIRDYQLAIVDRFVSVGSTFAAVAPERPGGQAAVKYLGECSLAAFVRTAKAVGIR